MWLEKFLYTAVISVNILQVSSTDSLPYLQDTSLESQNCSVMEQYMIVLWFGIKTLTSWWWGILTRIIVKIMSSCFPTDRWANSISVLMLSLDTHLRKVGSSSTGAKLIRFYGVVVMRRAGEGRGRRWWDETRGGERAPSVPVGVEQMSLLPRDWEEQKENWWSCYAQIKSSLVSVCESFWSCGAGFIDEKGSRLEGCFIFYFQSDFWTPAFTFLGFWSILIRSETVRLHVVRPSV